jgi:hypothetical protein
MNSPNPSIIHEIDLKKLILKQKELEFYSKDISTRLVIKPDQL